MKKQERKECKNGQKKREEWKWAQLIRELKRKSRKETAIFKKKKVKIISWSSFVVRECGWIITYMENAYLSKQLQRKMEKYTSSME